MHQDFSRAPLGRTAYLSHSCGTCQHVQPPDGGICHVAERLVLLLWGETAASFQRNDLLYPIKAKRKRRWKQYFKKWKLELWQSNFLSKTRQLLKAEEQSGKSFSSKCWAHQQKQSNVAFLARTGNSCAIGTKQRSGPRQLRFPLQELQMQRENAIARIHWSLE